MVPNCQMVRYHRTMKRFEVGDRIGGGADNDVYQDPHHPDRVIAVRKEGKEDSKERERKIKARFYLKRILHALFPENIPDAYRATSNPQATWRPKVPLDPLHRAIQKTDAFESGGEPVPPEIQAASDEAVRKIENDPKYKELIRKLENLGVEIDTTAGNFTYNEKGDAIVYVDDIHLEDADWQTENSRGYDEQKLGAAIEKIEDESARAEARNYFERLKALT